MKLFSKNKPAPTAEHVAQAQPETVVKSAKKQRSHPVLFLFMLLLVAGLAAAATYTIMKLASGSTKQTEQPAPQVQTAPAKTDAAAALSAVKAVFPGTSTEFEKPLLAVQSLATRSIPTLIARIIIKP